MDSKIENVTVARIFLLDLLMIKIPIFHFYWIIFHLFHKAQTRQTFFLLVKKFMWSRTLCYFDKAWKRTSEVPKFTLVQKGLVYNKLNCDWQKHVHLFYCVSHAIREWRCNLLLEYSGIYSQFEPPFLPNIYEVTSNLSEWF